MPSVVDVGQVGYGAYGGARPGGCDSLLAVFTCSSPGRFFVCVYVCVGGREPAGEGEREGGRGVGGTSPRWWEGGCSPPGPTSSAKPSPPYTHRHAPLPPRPVGEAQLGGRRQLAQGLVCLFWFFPPRCLFHGGQIRNVTTLPDMGGLPIDHIFKTPLPSNPQNDS